ANRQCKEFRLGVPRVDSANHFNPASTRHVHVKQHDLGLEVLNHLDCTVDVFSLSDDVDGVGDLRANARSEHRVVVNNGNPQLWGLVAHRLASSTDSEFARVSGSESATSVP